MNRTPIPATLLMESHGLAPNVRSQSFASINVWSKLYQAGPYFLDLVLGPGDDGLVLHGELLGQDGQPTPSKGRATLRDGAGVAVGTSDLRAAGEAFVFGFDIHASDSYHLTVVLDDESYTFTGLDV